MVTATCACGRVTADDECPPICNYNPKETEMNTTDYTAYIIEHPGDDFLSPVDLRTLDSERLRMLRDEGDYEMAQIIDQILHTR